MSSNTTFKDIPIIQEIKAPRLSWMRMASRIGFLVLLVLIPTTGLFRIDLSAGFVILDHQIWFSDFFIVFGFWLAIASLLILLYSSFGTVFCGWACPQNSVSTWANKTTSRLLGKRALINWGDDETNVKVSSGKNKKKNWFLLFLSILGMSMLVALLPLLYFFPPGAIWSFLTFQEDPRLAGSLHWIYTVFVFIAFANIAVVRHYVCRYMCIYRIWQFLFKTRDTLHIEYDASRGEECSKCNYCVTVCPVDTDPRNTAIYDSCTNCGECITACDNLHRKHGTKGLLHYKFGRRTDKEEIKNRVSLASFTRRASWVLPVFMLAVGMFIWGLVIYEPYHLSVYRADIRHGDKIQNYRINIANKRYEPATVSFKVSGIPDQLYELDSSEITFETATRKNLNLYIDDSLQPGLYTIQVTAVSQDGWQESYNFQHYVR